ncbi:MAG: L,D-transpeptidase family protein [Candidatus Acidiferrales bacterium]
MRRAQISKRLRIALAVGAVALVCGGVIVSARRALAQPGAAAAPPQQLSPEGRASLQTMIAAGNLAELRWPNFSDYGKHLQYFYDSYGYALPWVRGMEPSPQARQIIALFLNADQKGLSAEDYDGPRWAARLALLKPAAAHATEADALRFDIAMTVCLMRYISDLHIGKVNPKHFDFGLDVETKKYDLPEFVKANVVDAPDVGGVLAQVEPQYPAYKRAIAALDLYIELAKKQETTPLPAVKKTLGPGETYEGTPQLARMLRLVGDLPADANVPGDSNVYQEPLVDAVKKFQARHGRTVDGRLGAQTIADLNVPLSARVRQMQLTLERWRWLPVSFHSAPIVANIPEFRLRAYDEQFHLALTMGVVVGKAYDHDTPVFGDTMEYVIFRPYWNVPYSIARGEFFSRIARDPNYLANKGFAVVDSKQNVVAAGPVGPEVLEQLRVGKLFIRQNPGPKNSLGLVKFIFPNSYNVYMHDSPEQELFSRARRDFSHGCVRLERPADLAAFVLRDVPGWDMERVRAAMKNDPSNRQVNLPRPIPVLIVYGTAVVPEDGLVHFYDDIYGHDKELDQVLQKGYPYPG